MSSKCNKWYFNPNLIRSLTGEIYQNEQPIVDVVYVSKKGHNCFVAEQVYVDNLSMDEMETFIDAIWSMEENASVYGIPLYIADEDVFLFYGSKKTYKYGNIKEEIQKGLEKRREENK